jgi:alpha-amylase/alpha-mannosidase (GH57 family)
MEVKGMIYWAQLLHFYQPPTQLHSVLEKVCEESYRPLIEMFRGHPNARASVNINGVLTEMLHDHGMQDVIDGLRELAEAGQIELVDSAKYHPILPLLPTAEAQRQIAQNRRTNSFFFGPCFEPKGFFPPEMCYGQETASSIIASGHRWVIMRGVACPVDWPRDVIHYIDRDEGNLAVFFRDDVLSNRISFQELGPQDFLNNLKKLAGGLPTTYIVTAMDAETYGHHIQNWERLFLAEVYEELSPRRETHEGIQQAKELARQEQDLLSFAEASQEIEAVTISELLDLFPEGKAIEPKPSSWSTSGQDLDAGVPYPLWLDPGNEIHRLQWEHLNLCIDMVRQAQDCADNEPSRYFAGIARGLLDRATHSCQFWWASRRPMWDINLIQKGLAEQWETIVNAYKAIKCSSVGDDKKRQCYYLFVASRDLSSKIVDRLFLD